MSIEPPRLPPVPADTPAPAPEWYCVSERERFYRYVTVNGEDECWPWTGTTGDGYGVFRRSDGKSIRAHRLAYMVAVGPVPDGKVLDHICRRRDCVNPDHVRPVTIMENNLAPGSLSTHTRGRRGVLCPRGHASNWKINSRGHRECVTCERERRQRRTIEECSRRG